MARILGINLPDDKRVEYALTLFYGIGWTLSRQIMKKTAIETTRRVKDLKEEDLKKIAVALEEYTIEGDLREELNENMKRLREIASYRGSRHVHGLPARGQRTRSNARTKRGKRKTVGALKKEVWAKMEQGKPAAAEAAKK
jgi:small subunit ribosomal protein S13